MANSKSFSFADLIPEALTYKDEVMGGDGAVYDVQVRDLLSTEALVQFMRIDKQVRDLDLAAGVDDDDAKRIDGLTDQMLAILIPALPTARRQIIPLQLRMRFVEWWSAAQGDDAEGDGGAAPNAA